MKIAKPLLFGTLIKRYKRFLADVKLEDGSVITVHVANSGSMKTCATAGWKVCVSDSENPKRKLRYSLEMIHNGTTWIGVNTMLPNHVAMEGIKEGKVEELQGYKEFLSEQKYDESSRIDILLKKEDEACYVEVKNVTYVLDNTYLFPDAVTSRGLKHLNALLRTKELGHRAVMLYLVQRGDGKIFKPAKEIDPAYAQRLKEVHKNGVEVLVYQVDVQPNSLQIVQKIDFDLE